MKTVSEEQTHHKSKRLNDRKAIVTGATGGLGRAIVEGLAREGADVFLGVRSLAKGQSLQQSLGHPNIHLPPVPLNLADAQSISEFAEHFANSKIHILVCNAGLNSGSHSIKGASQSYHARIANSLPMQNFLGHFLLISKLEPSLMQTPGARIVSVSSIMSRFGSVAHPDTFLDGNSYANSKLAQACHMHRLQQRLKHHDVTAAVADPGGVNTYVWEGTPFSTGIGSLARKALFVSCERGAESVLHACMVPTSSGSFDTKTPFFVAEGAFSSNTVTQQLPSLTGRQKHDISALVRYPMLAVTGATMLLRLVVDKVISMRSPSPKRIVSVQPNPEMFDDSVCESLCKVSARRCGLNTEHA